MITLLPSHFFCHKFSLRLLFSAMVCFLVFSLTNLPAYGEHPTPTEADHPTLTEIPSSPHPNLDKNAPEGLYPEDSSEDFDPLEPCDPFEPVNRAIFEFNYVVDGLLLNPLIHIYRGITPSFIQERIHDVLTNLVTPVYFLNDLLQLEFEEAGVHFTRFWLNTVFGVLGLFDVAGEMGLQSKENNLYQTLGRWGIAPGPYIVIPILGPSDLRGVVGTVGDFFLDPINYAAIHTDHREMMNVRGVLTYVDKKSHLVDTQENLSKTSLDYYAALRSMYWQRTYAKVQAIQESEPGELDETEVVFF